MNWLILFALTLVSVLALALISHITQIRKHWAIQWSAIVLCGFALYCYIRADLNGEIHLLSNKIAVPLVNDYLQPFALSNLGQRIMKFLQFIIDILEYMIAFIDDHTFALVIGSCALIFCIIWIKDKKNR